MVDIGKLTDTQLNTLVENRWTSSYEVWDTIEKTYKSNTAIYSNKSDWLDALPERRQKFRIQANRIFVNMESVINSLIAEPPGINVLPAHDGDEPQDFARKLERFLRKKYSDLNTKETLRMGLRNMYFGRLIVIKAFWNTKRNDFDYRAIDPRKVRFGKYARKEIDSEFAIEEIEDNLVAVIARFPAKKEVLMKKYAITTDDDLYIKNPEVKYKESWIGDWVIFKCDQIILDKIKNPYWDWEGVLITDDEETQLASADTSIAQRREMMMRIKLDQSNRQTQSDPTQQSTDANTMYKSYFYNYFDTPRKPYIYATILNNENCPIGRIDMITLSSELQRGIDKRKMDIDENCELANGVLKVDSSVMGKSDAQRIRFETKGIIWGKGVKEGVTRETGQALPQMVFDDMQDSRDEIDSIMAANSAFKGNREGEETKGGRLALIAQSYLQLNEMIQVVDFVSKEIFNWGMQMVKTRYTEPHIAKWAGKDDTTEMIEIIQDDIDNGSEVIVTAGKTLPVDDEFKYQQAQKDVELGFLAPIDYLEIANYDNAKELAKNAYMYKVAPASQLNLSPEEQQQIPPAPVEVNKSMSYDELPATGKVQFLQSIGIKVTEDQINQEGVRAPVSIAYDKLSPDLQEQVAQQQGWKANPNILVAEKMAQQKQEGEAHQAQVAQQLANAHATLNPEPKEKTASKKK